MNLLHLKYAVEVEKTRSINKAAENLLMGQPNLSRAIRELEEFLGITIFKRSPKGIKPTPQGEEFLSYAKSILTQVDEVEKIYKSGRRLKQKFSISTPGASYISHAFTEFVKKLDTEKDIELSFKETNALQAIENIIDANYNLGIIRCRSGYEKYFEGMFFEKGLKSRELLEFKYMLAMSEKHPLVNKETLTKGDLKNYIEIAHGDPFIPAMPAADVKKAELSELNSKHIFIFERGSQFDLLSSVHNTYMWVSPIPEKLLERYKITLKVCEDNLKKYKDILIYKKEYRFSQFDKMFFDELEKAKKI